MERSRTLGRVLVIATAVVVLFALGISSTGANAARPDAKPSPPSVKGNRVLLVGDSLLWQSIPQVRAALASEQWEPTITAAPATTIGSWTGRMKGLIASARPDVVVIELGTNNCVAACPRIEAVVDQMMRQIPWSIPVVWLNVQAQPTYPAHPESVNDALAAARTRFTNLTLIDMSARFRNHPEWHLVDGLHLSASGSDQLGAFITESLRATR